MQAPSPSASEGLTVIPSGKVTTAFLMSDWASPAGLVRLSSATSRLKLRPVELCAAPVVVATPIVGPKPIRSQPFSVGMAMAPEEGGKACQAAAR